MRNKLNDVMVRNAKGGLKPAKKPGSKPITVEGPYRMSDGDGLYLWVSLTGAKSWQIRYLLGGRELVATLGTYPDTTLSDARSAAEDARKRIAKGEHLTVSKNVAKAQRQADTAATFGILKAEWVDDEAKRQRWTADYRGEVEASLRNHLAKLDDLPVTAIIASVCSPHLRRVERAAPDMARKVRQRLRGILDLAVEQGLITSNPLPTTRRGLKLERKHLPAVLDKEGVGAILRAAENAEVCKGVRRTHILCAFTAQRPGEVVGAVWDEFDLVRGIWTIPRPRMKRKDAERGPHMVPLPPGLLATLVEWRRADGEDAVHVCPAPRKKDAPVLEDSCEKFYRRKLGLRGKHVPHGWRSVLSTWADNAGDDPLTVDAQHDHVLGNKVQISYNRGQRFELRKALMATHEQRLIAARDGATVISLSGRRA